MRLHVLLDQFDKRFGDVLTTQGYRFFAIDKDRRGRRFASTRQRDADVGVTRFARAVDHTTHHRQSEIFGTRMATLPTRHAQIGRECVGKESVSTWRARWWPSK